MKFITSLLLFSLCIFQIKGDNSAKIVHFAKSKIGNGYMYKGTGQTLTEDYLNKMAKKYPNDIDPEIVKRWIGYPVYDCSGLVTKAFETINVSIYHGANSAWLKTDWESTGEISNYPKDKVFILYRKNKSGTMSHTGIYIGGGKFIHAKSSEDGVVMENMPYTWTHWGIPKGLY